jgi:hypothetical protein
MVFVGTLLDHFLSPNEVACMDDRTTTEKQRSHGRLGGGLGCARA